MALFSKDKEKHVEITISPKTIFTTVLVAMGSFLLLRLIVEIAWPLQLIAIAAFLAMALNPAVSWIAQRLKSKSRARATAVAYLVVLLVLTGFLLIAIPPIIKQGAEVASDIPTSVTDLQNQDTPMVRFINDNGLQDEYSQLVTNVRDSI